MTIYPLIPQRHNPESAAWYTGKVQLAAASTQLKIRTVVKDKPPVENPRVLRKKRQNKRTCRRPQAGRPFELKSRKSGIRHIMRSNK